MLPGTVHRPRIIVCGHQRSGTSLLAHVLSQATMLSLEDDPEWTFQHRIKPVIKCRKQLLAYLKCNLSRTPRPILKAPGCTVVADAIREVASNVVFVFSVRDPRDNIAAVLEWRNARDKDANDPWWDQSWLEIDGRTRVEKLAKRWVLYNSVVWTLPGSMFVRYEDLCADSDAAIAEVCSSIGTTVVHRIAGLQSRQLNKNFGDRAIRGPGRWTSDLTPEDLQIISDICSEAAAAFNYSI